jgi:hypothetical protein
VVTLRNGIDVCEEGRGTEGVKSAPDNTFDFLVRPSRLVSFGTRRWPHWLIRVVWFGY